MAQQLFLASTPLHILNSVAIASQTPGQQSCLWVIDQPQVGDNPYLDVLRSWDLSPFSEVKISQGHIKPLKAKLAHRKKVFADIDFWIAKNQPSEIYTGNDRRIEFQYAMHATEAQGVNCNGFYMDEGTFTYVGRAASASFSDRVIDNLLKKITYGRWWKHPPTIGGSEWISGVYAAFPDLIHPLLKSKTVIPLQPLYKKASSVSIYCRLLSDYLSAPTNILSSLDCVLTLPHESIIEKIPGYQAAMSETLTLLTAQGLKVGVKYHPRNENPDILQAADMDNTLLIPHKIPFEALLPVLKDNIIIIGDVSSTLINARWLKPEATLLSVMNDTLPKYQEFCALFGKLGVSVSDANGIIAAIKEELSSAKPEAMKLE